MASRQLDEERIFQVARWISDSEALAEYLDQVCSGDQALRKRVEDLLAVSQQDKEFLKSSGGRISETIDLAASLEGPGTTIGPYKLRERLGAGGMGVVYAAERKQPIRQKVALKLIKPGMDTDDVLARFEAEREALAMMEHPNIAKVLDAGMTDSGRPYFVMELISGIPINEYCTTRDLSLAQKLELFIQVCRAVQHAHQKGIIHRDIKPSNILVTEHDGVPIPKVIDFGVAKALHRQLTDRSIYTGVFQAIGTLAYMSPEQASLSSKDVDVCTDVYGLGVLLYELLTGTTPFARETLEQAALDEALRVIREEDAPKPSTRMTTLRDRVNQNQDRTKQLASLVKRVKGDLDCIVMKALEKDRTRRYATADALAVEVQKYLSNEPVDARPPSAMYRFSRFYRRHKAVVNTSLAVLASMVVSLIGMTWLAFYAMGQAEVAAIAERQASLETEKANAENKRATNLLDKVRESREHLRQSNYARTLSAAFAALDHSNPEAAQRLLDSLSEDDLPIALGLEVKLLQQMIRSAIGQEGARQLGMTYRFCQPSFSSDGRFLAIPVPELGVKLVEIHTGTESWLLNSPELRQGLQPVSACFSRHGQRLAVGLADRNGKIEGALCLFDLSQPGEQDFQTVQTSFEVWRINFSEQDDEIVALSRLPSLHHELALFDASQLQKKWSIVMDAPLRKAIFTSDGTSVLVGHGFIGMSLLDRKTGQLRSGEQFEDLSRFISGSMEVLPDGQTMITTSGDVQVHWNLQTMKPISIEPVPPGRMGVAISQIEPRVFASKNDRCSIQLSDWETGTVLRTVQETVDIERFELSPTGSHLVTISLSGEVKLWNIAKSRESFCDTESHWFLPIEIINDRTVVLAGTEGQVHFWNPEIGHFERRARDDQRRITALEKLPNGLLAIGCVKEGDDRCGTLQVWNIKSWELEATYEFEAGSIWSLAYCEENDTLAVGGAQGAIDLLWGPKFEFMGRLKEKDGNIVRSLDWTPDGRLLLSGSGTGIGGEVTLWNPATHEAIWNEPRGRRVDSVAFSPDGESFVFADRNGFLQLRPTDTPDNIRFEKKGRGSYLASVCFNANGDRLICAGISQIILIRVSDGEEVGRLKTDDSVRRVAVLGDDSAIISAGSNGVARIWRADAPIND